MNYFQVMADNMDKEVKPSKKSTVCGHFMQSWDSHKVCFKCREAGKGDDLCTQKKDCLICVSFSEDQKKRLHVVRKKKSDKPATVTSKSSFDDSLLDEDDSSNNAVPSGSSSGTTSQTLASILAQLTTISSRLSAVEKREVHVAMDTTDTSTTRSQKIISTAGDVA